MRIATALAAALAIMLTVTLATTRGPADPTFVQAPEQIAFAALTPFGACDELLDYVTQHALDQVGPYGLGGGPVVVGELAVEGTDAAGAADTAARASAVPTDGDASFSGTNVAERGVDEPDIVKTDGRRLFTVVDRELRALDVSGDAPAELGRLRLDQEWGNELLLDGDRLLVLATAYDQGGFPGRPMPLDDIATDRMIMPAHSPSTVLTMVDVSDPSRMRVLETLTLDGSYLSARLVDGTARVVVRAEPTGLPFVFPAGGGLRAEEEATERNREIIRESTVDSWLPFFIHTDAAGVRSDGTLLECQDVHHPREFAGLGTVNVLSMPLAGGLRPQRATAVLASGETIAASSDRLYVATNRWFDPAAVRPGAPADTDFTTEIHGFDITAPEARYVGSGVVPGHLLNQFSMSEHAGMLRVASTIGSPWFGEGPVSESRVTVLAEADGVLEEVGAVGGLGLDERIHAVRFIGDIGYVVTFRQIDPLYTIDLSDPTSPVVRGELKIPGYSAYLHPIGDGLVLGVGQDATDEGRILGAQLSLFDVSDLDDPRRVATHTLGEPTDGTWEPGAWEPASTEVEHDHRAFLHWPATDSVVVPYQQGRWDEESHRYEGRQEAAVVSVADGEIRPIGGVSHLAQVAPEGPGTPRYEQLAWSSTIRRSLVVEGTLLTVSHLGVLASDLDDLSPRGWVAFSS